MFVHDHDKVKALARIHMKQLAFALFTVLFISSCGESQPAHADRLRDAVLDTVLLGYRLKMPYDEMLKHSKTLIDAGTISLDESAFRYDMQLDEYESVQASFIPMPHNNVIYKVALMVPAQGRVSTPELITLKMQLLLSAKYGLPTETKPQDRENTAESCAWVFKNARIELIQSFDGALILYFDTALDQEIRQADADTAAERVRATRQNL